MCNSLLFTFESRKVIRMYMMIQNANVLQDRVRIQDTNSYRNVSFLSYMFAQCYCIGRTQHAWHTVSSTVLKTQM